jgi:hypothetical protein
VEASPYPAMLERPGSSEATSDFAHPTGRHGLIAGKATGQQSLSQPETRIGRSEPVAEGTGNALAGQPGVDKVRCIPACIQTSRAPFDLIVLDSTVRLCRGLQRRKVRRPQTDLLADNNRMQLLAAHW